MILSLTLLLGTVSFLYYGSRTKGNLKEKDNLDFKSDRSEEDLYKSLEDLFI